MATSSMREGNARQYRRSVTSLGAMMRHVAGGAGGMDDIGEDAGTYRVGMSGWE